MSQEIRSIHVSAWRVSLLALAAFLAICLAGSPQASAAGGGGGHREGDDAQQTKRHGKTRKGKGQKKKQRLRKQRLDRARSVLRSGSGDIPMGSALAPASGFLGGSTEGEEIAPYSENPSELRPHYICPPATEKRATCMSIATADPEALEDRGLMVPQYEGSGENGGFSPADIQDAYNLPAEGGEGMTVAITIAYHNPKLESDLAIYRSKYGLPPCTTANGCLKRVNQKGEEKNYPPGDASWGWEASLDVDMVSAACPKCKILVVEANNESSDNLDKTVEVAASFKPDAISNSWSSKSDIADQLKYNHYFDQPGIPVLFASGNWGHKPSFPATSPHVIAVGGTDLKKAANARGWSETAWGDTGGGCSRVQEKPAWQKDIGCDKRTVNDVSAVASTSTPVSIYDSYGGSGWQTVGGTSAATPIVAGIEALSSSAVRAAGPSAFHRIGQAGGLFDVTAETNEEAACEVYLCRARPGYDGPTGWGTPNGPLSAPVAVTEAASVASTSKATLRGSVLPGGVKTEYFFQYGKTSSYGTKLPIPKNAGSGSEYVEVGETVEGLVGGTTYHYRIGAFNSKGTFYGLDRTFRTTPPTVATEEPSEVSGHAATLEATVNPEGLDTIYWFEYGPTTAYGEKVEALGTELGAGSESVSVSTGVDLMSMRAYHYRVVAKNLAGISYGKDQEFTTPWSEWQAKTLPDGTIEDVYEDIHCLQPSSCMAIGYQLDGNGSYMPLAGKWDGSTMSEIPVPDPSGSVETRLHSISCTTVSNCVAVGRFEDTGGNTKLLAERWDGSVWKEMTIPIPSEATTTQLEGVSCISTQCIAVGRYKIGGGQWKALAELWNGSTWSVQTVAVPEKTMYTMLNGVSCTATNACTAVGELYKTSGGFQAYVNRWNGATWSLQSPVTPEGKITSLTDVSCTSSTHCTAMGETSSNELLIERWNGTAWSIETIPYLGDFEWLSDISCLSATACTTAGYAYDEGVSSSVMRRWNGSSWSFLDIEEIQAPAGGNQRSLLRTVACPTTSSCVALGTNWTIGPGETHFKGTDFIEYTPPRVPVVGGSGVTGNTGTEAVLEATLNPAGLSTTYQFEYGETKAYGSKVPASAVGIGSGTMSVKVDETLKGLLPGSTYHFRVVATNSAGTTYGNGQKFVAFIPPPTFDFAAGSQGTGPGQFADPNGVAVDSEGHAWVTDAGRQVVQEFGPEGEYLSQFGLSSPEGIEVGPEGHLWALTSGGTVKELDHEGKLLSQFSGSEAAELWCPTDIALDPEGDVWVPDICSGQVYEFSSTGALLGHVGEPGSTPGKLSSPRDVAFDPDGDLWVLDSLRVQQFTQNDEYLSGFGEKGSGVDQLEDARGVAIDAYGNIWVTDSGTRHVKEFNPAGDQLTEFGEAGAGPGQFGYLSGIATDPGGDLWVLDPGNYRIQHWLPSKPPAATTEAATAVKATSATLHGTVNPRGVPTSYWFEYGKTTAYGSKVPVPAQSAGAGTTAVAVSAPVKGLTPGATYHYRLVAANAGGTRRGADQTFTTVTALILNNVLGEPAGAADFWDANLTVDSFAKWPCEEFKLRTSITKNEANPVTLVSSGTSTISGCKSGSSSLNFSGIETTAAMTLYADGSGSLPLRLTETTSPSAWTCVREGTLTLDADFPSGDVSFSGSLKKVSGTSGCPSSAKFEGTFTRVTEAFGFDVQWIGSF